MHSEASVPLNFCPLQIFRSARTLHLKSPSVDLLFKSIQYNFQNMNQTIDFIPKSQKSFIKKARRVRKVFGGGMRQAGYMAATGIYALENHVHRLTEDHARAKQIAAAISKKDFCAKLFPVQTNILIFELNPSYTTKQITETLRHHTIHLIAMTPTQIRIVLHLGITQAMVDYAIDIIEKM